MHIADQLNAFSMLLNDTLVEQEGEPRLDNESSRSYA